MAILTTDPKVLLIAFVGGIIPSLLWLWFWLKEEENPEPKLLLTFVFILGMLSVMIVLPIQQFIQDNINSYDAKIILWASAEEVLKFLAVMIVLYKSHNADEPIDWPIYLITGALGFAALENTLFLIKPLSINEASTAILSGQLRFLGSTLLHAITSGAIGVAMGISFFMKDWQKKLSVLVGFIIAIALHSAFNFFIMGNDGNDFLKVFAFLWVVTIIIMLLLEKVRRMSE
ncbi:PrsW family intramembrane metalloprotease [Candidatus Nomurabacteria bacterium]|nr:PrsW family intramembrane metalloprotease [Candidatus Nomurabacteria bacterium]